MPSIRINDQAINRPFAYRHTALQYAVDKLGTMSIGAVATVWEGDTQTAQITVARINGEAHVISRELWPAPQPWQLHTRGLSTQQRQRLVHVLRTL